MGDKRCVASGGYQTDRAYGSASRSHNFKQRLEIKHLAGKGVRHQGLQPGIVLLKEFFGSGQRIDLGLDSIGNAIALNFREQFQEPA